MSLFVCDKCGCVEDTSLGYYHMVNYYKRHENKPFSGGFSWANGMHLCSECCPPIYSDGSISEKGRWHCEFSKEKATVEEIQLDPISWCWSSGMEKLFKNAGVAIPKGLIIGKFSE